MRHVASGWGLHRINAHLAALVSQNENSPIKVVNVKLYKHETQISFEIRLVIKIIRIDISR